METRVIGIGINSGDNKNKARKTTLSCMLPAKYSCPYLEQGECIEAGTFLAYGCIYGHRTYRHGYTTRAKKHGQIIRRWATEKKEHGSWPKSPKHPCLTIIGSYIWLGAYPFIDMIESLPAYMTDPKINRYHKDTPFYPELHGVTVSIKSPGGAFRTGIPWIRTEDFTPRVAAVLALGRPQALMDGEIKEYQDKQVPRFLFALKHVMPDLWEQTLTLIPELALRLPSLDAVRDKTTSVYNVPPGTAIALKGKGNIKIVWNGERVTLTGSKNLKPIFLIWTTESDTQFDISFVPPRNYQVLVKDDKVLGNLWDQGKIHV